MRTSEAPPPITDGGAPCVFQTGVGTFPHKGTPNGRKTRGNFYLPSARISLESSDSTFMPVRKATPLNTGTS